MATTEGYQGRIAAFARQLSEEIGEADASKGVRDRRRGEQLECSSETLLTLHADPRFYPRDLLRLCRRDDGSTGSPGLVRLLPIGAVAMGRQHKSTNRAVRARSEELGPPGKEDAETSPRKVVVRTLGYLKNQQSRMKYDEYRKLGLPITSSHIESTIKQINRRVKGSEKFWHEGAEPLLQLAADHLSETNNFDHFWNRRSSQLRSTRPYQSVA